MSEGWAPLVPLRLEKGERTVLHVALPAPASLDGQLLLRALRRLRSTPDDSSQPLSGPNG